MFWRDNHASFEEAQLMVDYLLHDRGFVIFSSYDDGCQETLRIKEFRKVNGIEKISMPGHDSHFMLFQKGQVKPSLWNRIAERF